MSHKLGLLASNTPFFTLLDSNGTGDWELRCGWQSVNNFSALDFDALTRFQTDSKDWLFGHLGYDLKNQLENLQSSHVSRIGFPDLHFYRPRFTLEFAGEEISLGYLPGDEAQANELLQLLLAETQPGETEADDHGPEIKNITAGRSREEYLQQVSELLRHIARGDIYEINYCMEFFAEQVQLNPETCFRRLNAKAKAPFSALYRLRNNWLMCASPERYLKKTGRKIISQPIKGTIRRGKDAAEDERLKNQLLNDPKERCENVMIVDLVRNDLSRVAERGSVRVEELFGVYAFETVHQLISTVAAELRPDCSGVDALKATFPMGSMTGAPKVRAMQLAEHYEGMKRGLYSGALGYFTPDGDFDFNVVIRSIQYNEASGALSLMVGSAITHYASPEKEYEECLLKAQALFDALGIH